MLFRRYPGKRLEPVGVMGRAPLNSPILHRMGYHICNAWIQFCPIFNGLFQFLIYAFGQTLPHDRVIEHVLTEHL